MMVMKSAPEFSSSRGSALIYVLIAVALLAALTVSMMEPSSQQAQSQNATNLGAELESQIGFITAGDF
jgi:type II secretory pathway component PulK